MTKQIDEEFTINLFDLAFYLWAKKQVIAVMCVVGAIAGGLYGIFGTPEYISKSIISPNAQRSALSDFVEVLPTSGTGAALLETRLTSRSISERVIELEPEVARVIYADAWDEEAGQWKDSVGPTVVSAAGRLRNKHLEVSANSRKGTVDIIVNLPDSAFAKRIADAYLKALKESIQENISADLEENRVFLESQYLRAEDPQIKIRIQSLIARNVEMALVNNPKDFQVVEHPSYPAGKAGPKRLRSIVVGVFAAGVGSVFMLFGLLMLKSMGGEWRKRKELSPA